MSGVFIIGTDTGVGKTITCAGFLQLIRGQREVAYWKPVQTGTIVGDDTATVKEITGLPSEFFFEPTYRFPEPLSPHMAAKKWGKTVELDALMVDFNKISQSNKFIVIEGAGGVLVPFNEKTLQIDFIKKIGFPVIIISEDRVGSINQTLLSLIALREQKVNVLGVVLTKARRTLGNKDAIVQFGNVEVLAEIDPSEDPRQVAGYVASNERLRSLFNVGNLP